MLLAASTALVGQLRGPPQTSQDVRNSIPLIYREAQGPDYQRIADLRVQAFCPHLVSTGSKYLQARLFHDTMRTKTAVLVASTSAFAGGDIAASADLLVVQPPGTKPGDQPAAQHYDVQPSTCCYVSNVCVATSARRRGIGRKLMALALQRAAALRADQLVLHVEKDNVAAGQLYASMGFEPELLHPTMREVFTAPPFVDPAAPEQWLLSMHVTTNAGAGDLNSQQARNAPS